MKNKDNYELLKWANERPTHLGRVIAKVEIKNHIRQESINRQNNTQDGKVKWIFSL